MLVISPLDEKQARRVWNVYRFTEASAMLDVASRSVGILPTSNRISTRKSFRKTAGNARKALETQSGNKISTTENQHAFTDSKKRIARKKS
jgi:hypothetical protein